MKPQLLASAPSLTSLSDSISRYYGGSSVTLTPAGGDTWSVATGKGNIASVRVVKKRGRYRFETVPA